jgi:hypothetical protein
VTAADAGRRRDVLADLVKLRLPPDAAVAAVRALPWDSVVEMVVLARRDAHELLQRYLRGELSPSDVESWADAVESRDDIGFESGHEELLRAFVFETANPVLFEPISETYARRWLDRFGDVLPD